MLIFFIPENLYGKNPPEFDKAKKEFSNLKAKKGNEKAWRHCSASFLKVYKNNPKWKARVAALFRYASSLEELSKITRKKSDAQSAAVAYKKVAEKHPSSSLADDSLYAAAVLYHKRLNNKKSSITCLNIILKKYPNGDFAGKSSSYLSEITGKKNSLRPQKAHNSIKSDLTKEIDRARQNRTKNQEKEEDKENKISYLGKGNPTLYEEAKARLNVLKLTGGRADQWQSCADRFLKIYKLYPKWNLKYAALFRHAVALEGKAKSTGKKADINKAVNAYMETVQKHPNCSLADDALFACACLYAEFLNDKKKAKICLNTILKKYSRSDFASKAKSYLAELSDKNQIEGKKQARNKKLVNFSEEVVPLDQKKVEISVVQKLHLAIRTIVLDPGHGGKDPGTSHNGIIEQDTVLDVGLRLRKILKEMGFAVKMTRDRKKWLTLKERVEFGKISGGDIFVSIHVNACPNRNVMGLESYTFDFARSGSVQRLAVIENADSGRLGEVSRILAELEAGIRTKESRRLAASIQNGTVSYMRNRGIYIKDGGKKGAPFFVLVGAKVPSILIELGYCTNVREAESLRSSAYKQNLAEGIANGILQYAKNYSQ